MNWNCQIFTPQVGTSSPRGRLHSPGGPNPAAGASPRLKPPDPDKTKLKTRLATIQKPLLTPTTHTGHNKKIKKTSNCTS